MKNAIRTITNVTTTPFYTPEAIKTLMRRLKLNEKSLALLLNVAPVTVKFWITGAVNPSNLSRRMLQLYELYPDIIDKLAEGGEDY